MTNGNQQHPTRKNDKIFDTAADTRKFEIGLFWQRSLFFWGFIAAAFLAYADLVKDRDQDPVVITAIASFGLVCSVAWTLANRGSKYWQNAWEAKIETVEHDALGARLFSEPYTPRPNQIYWWGIWSRSWHYSVSRLATALSDFAVMLWIVLMANSVAAVDLADRKTSALTALVLIGTAIQVTAMLIHGRSKN
jgi:hypothetical protein